MNPTMAAVADAAASVIDALLTTMRRSLVMLAVPSLNMYARAAAAIAAASSCAVLLTLFADSRQNRALRPI